jgi:hypothetical protein
MGTRLKYDSTRLILFTLALAVLYFAVLPGNWPEPRVEVNVPALATLGEDLRVDVTVKAWHGNFSLRQVSFSVSSTASPALVPRRSFVPVNIYDREKKWQWSVGFAARATWPRARTFRLGIPLKQLALDGTVTTGELHGTIDVVVDYTKVTMRSGYPALTVRRNIPYAVEIRQ